MLTGQDDRFTKDRQIISGHYTARKVVTIVRKKGCHSGPLGPYILSDHVIGPKYCSSVEHMNTMYLLVVISTTMASQQRPYSFLSKRPAGKSRGAAKWLLSFYIRS